MRHSYSESAVCCLSGTGKTLLARAIASNIDANFLKVRAGREKCGAKVWDKCLWLVISIYLAYLPNS